MFDQSQIAEFKEAFTLIDANRDGFICGEDLQDIYSSLGRDLKDPQKDEMLAEGAGPINFQVFLGMFGDKISGTDPEDTIKQAFHVLAGNLDYKSLCYIVTHGSEED